MVVGGGDGGGGGGGGGGGDKSGFRDIWVLNPEWLGRVGGKFCSLGGWLKILVTRRVSGRVPHGNRCANHTLLSATFSSQNNGFRAPSNF